MRYALICLLLVGCSKGGGSGGGNVGAAKNPFTVWGTVLKAKIVKVTLSGKISRTTNTGADSVYRFTRVPDGTYTATPSLEGYTFVPPKATVDRNHPNANFVAVLVVPEPPPPLPPPEPPPPPPPPPLTYPVWVQWRAPTKDADGTPLEDLAGFKVYRGASPGAYDPPTDVQTASSYLFNLEAGTYYISVTAYDTAGNESAYSQELKVTVP